MTREQVDGKYEELIESYLNVKPILLDLYKRNGNRYIDGILNEIRALNDHVARCYRQGVTYEQAYDELCKAEGHLKRLIYDSFKQLNIIFYDFVSEYEEKYFSSQWICLDAGSFWEEYTRRRRNIVIAIEEAKIFESKDSEKAFEKYQEAYVEQGKVYELIIINKSSLESGRMARLLDVVNTNRKWFWSTMALAVIPAVIWEIFCHRFEIWNWALEMFKSFSHWLGEILMRL